MNGYICIYRNNTIEVHANTGYEAQKIAAEKLKARKSYEVSVYLAEKNGEEYVHSSID